jgi:cell wall-associated NlpC family hydrolase
LRFTSPLPAIGLATIMAITAFAVQASPVTATDPTPSPDPAPTAVPSADPAPTAAPTVEPGTEPAPIPAPTADPAPVDPSPSPVSTPATVVAAAPAPAAVPTLMARYLSAARIAIAQRHDRYVSGAAGPSAFDCSGLVRYSYRKAGISGRLGGGRSARGMLSWARLHGKTSRRNPHVGDVVIWGNGRHAGIYIGNGRVISALNPRQDIRITGLHALGDPFTAFIHTH